jgi:ABC-2 type transport system ATP-binding protein
VPGQHSGPLSRRPWEWYDRRMAAVEVEDLRVRRGGREVLHGLTFQVPRGTVVGLVGPSGGGKTTVMRVVVGVQRGVLGRVEVLGLPAGSAALRPRVGYVTQSPAVYADLSVQANLDYFAALVGADAVRVRDVFADVALTDAARQRVGTLSGGQRARVSLAVALLGEPELLVLDEPTVGLDPVLRRDLWAMFAALAEGGATLLVSSHVMDEAARCTRLLILRDGRLVADEAPRALLDRTGAPDLDAAFLALASQEQRA